MAENNTLATIRTKVRRLTRSLSPSQLTDVQIDEYINTFIRYDFPEHLRLFNLKTTFDFYTSPFIDVYETSDNLGSQFKDFINKYITIHPPVYVSGNPARFVESREELYRLYPNVSQIASINSLGDGVTTTFRGTITNTNGGTCLVRNNVMFNSIDVDGNGLTMIDYPISSVEGNLYVPGTNPTSTTVPDPNNYINYVSGIFVVTFPTAPLASANINSQIVPASMARPTTVMFYDGKFTLRPVPDQAYKISVEAYQRPTELLVGTERTKLAEWWQYIAYGAAKKVFEDRMDLESVQQIMPEFKQQEEMILRRTLVERSSQRVATIYSTSYNGLDAYGPNNNTSL